MVMRKIFFGTIVFSSLAFLDACGSSGSSGSDGTAGDKGDTGETGSISLPSADDKLSKLDIEKEKLLYFSELIKKRGHL